RRGRHEWCARTGISTAKAPKDRRCRDPMKRRHTYLGAAMLAVLAILPAGSRADVGVLLPQEDPRPDPERLALRTLSLAGAVDGPHAEVHVAQVFQNLTDAPIQGKYVFPLSDRARVVSFAIWEGAERIPAVVVDKRQGRRLYEELVRQEVDPGLVEAGD